jgi:uncharacterized membrane protein YcaP (DUF421 family)
VEDGKPILAHMNHSHISPHDLHEQLRLQGVDDIQEVRRAYKERNGEISVLKRKNPPKIFDVAVADGIKTVRIELG